MPEQRIYRPVPDFTREEINSALRSDDVDSLVYIAFAVGYHAKDCKYAQDICIQLSDHPNKTVRGNALLGLSYLALFQGKLNKRLIKPILLRALRDQEEEVRKRAQNAIFEINRAMGWRMANYQRKDEIEGAEETD